MKMAPVPAFPIATPGDKLPIAKMKLPPDFKAEVWASDVLDARGLQGDKGHGIRVLAVSWPARSPWSTRAAKRGQDPRREAVSCQRHPSSYKGSLYVAARDITRFCHDDIENRLDAPPGAGDGLRQAARRGAARLEVHQVGPDGKLYVPIGALRASSA